MDYKRILITTEQLHTAVRRLAQDINAHYGGRPVTALILLEGAKYFAADLIPHLTSQVEQTFLKLSSYTGTTSGSVVFNPDSHLQEKLKGKDVLIIDDIYDTGKTLSHLLQWLDVCSPRSMRTCVLVEKDIPHEQPVTIDFPGLKVPDVFVIGYGMDFNGRCRDLPFIAELADEYTTQ